MPAEPSSSQAPALDPEEIRAIRERLGLSQAEAGQLIGGGPRAFTKYEAGTVKPAAAVVKLLRLLERNPDLIGQLRTPESPPAMPSLTLPPPFQIGVEDVERFNEWTFPELLRRLLFAEARVHGLPTDGIHVASNITAPDGGEDGRIKWEGGPDRTRYLPCRFNQFQLKAGPVKPSQAAKDVLRNKQLQPMVRTVLEAGGHYRMLCARRYTQRAIDSRTQQIRDAVRKAGYDGQITFWGAEQIADWVNQHAAVAIWAKEEAQPGTVGPFRSWTHWAGHSDHDGSPWAEDERLPPLRDRLHELAATPQSVLRLVGLSGIGKSRLALEALGPRADHAVSDIVMFADESETDTSAILYTVDALAAAGTRAVVVVNHCSSKTHRHLDGYVRRRGSRLSLATLDDEIPTTTPDENTVEIKPAPTNVVEAMVKRLMPSSSSMDHERLAHFAAGFPRIAIKAAKAWRSSRPIAHAEDDDIVDAFVLGRQESEHAVIMKSAMLVAAFGEVAVEPDGGDLEEVASFRHDLSAEDLRIGISKLVKRDVVQRKGRLRVLQPRPVAMRLAERQWEEWSPYQWERILASEGNRYLGRLRATAAGVLAGLNATPIAHKVVRHVCRLGTSLGQAGTWPGNVDLVSSHWIWPAKTWPRNVDVLPAIAEVAPDIVLQTVEDSLSNADDLYQLVDDPRRHVVSALERIAFHADVFHQAARLLLRLAAAETETWANNATGVFIGLFKAGLGSTAADGDARLTFLDEVLNEVKPIADTGERRKVVEALIASLTPSGLRFVGAELQGSSPALRPWLPPTKDAKVKYVTGCISRLADIAVQECVDSATQKRARSGLGQRIRSWIGPDYIEALEDAIRRVSSVVSPWPEAIEGLGHVLKSDANSHSPAVVRRVEALLKGLRPTSLEDRIHFLVTAMPWNYPADQNLEIDERSKRQEEDVRRLAMDLAHAPQALERALPELSRGEQAQAFIFGELLGELTEQFKPYVWRRRITKAALEAPEQERDLSLLSGYIVGIARKCPKMEVPLKKRLTQSQELALEFPRVCSRLGVKSPDIELAVDALRRGVLRPHELHLWGLGGTTKRPLPLELAPLLDELMTHEGDEALAVAIHLIASYRLAELGMHRLMGKCLAKCARSGQWPAGTMASYHLERFVDYMLAKGRQDSDACATALDLAGIIVESWRAGGEHLPSSITRKLLSDFPEVVWPRIGAAIIADPVGLAWAMKLLDDEPLILSLPVATLFSWCHAHPDAAPAFAARLLPVFKPGEEQALHPTLSKLIDDFGERKDVLDGITSNIGTYGWVGSMTGYYRQFLAPVRALEHHPTAAVRRWATRTTRWLKENIERARDHDAESDARWEF